MKLSLSTISLFTEFISRLVQGGWVPRVLMEDHKQELLRMNDYWCSVFHIEKTIHLVGEGNRSSSQFDRAVIRRGGTKLNSSVAGSLRHVVSN